MIQLSGTQHFLQECMSAQQRLGSKCANGQSDQSFGRALFGYQCTFRRTAKTLNFLVGNAVPRTIYHYEPATKPTKWHVRPANSDQPGRLPSLIKVFEICMKKSWVLSYPLSAQQRLGTDWVDTKADLSLRWAHMPFVGYFVRWLIWYFDNHH